MLYPTSPVEVSLARRRIIRFHDAAGLTLRVLSGMLWITQDREVEDIILEAGHCFALTRNGKTVISALKDARVVIMSATADVETKKGLRWQALGMIGAPGRI
ncbi:MAG: DUF2917 domain-containing protein [Burkholderiales bacterium]